MQWSQDINHTPGKDPQLDRMVAHITPKHEHQHVVAVEWLPNAQHPTSGTVKVTKLRCACGDEVER